MDNEDMALSAQEQMQLAMQAQEAFRGRSEKIVILGRTYTLHPVTNRIDERIGRLAYDALIYEQEMKAESTKPRRMKKLYRKLRRIPAKMAAYYKLGRLAHIPLFHAVYWRILYNRSEEVSATINARQSTGVTKDFFLANSDVVKYLLALSMRGVGESVRQMLERMESAENMLDKDASPKKEEGSKSPARSSKVRPTKR